MDYTVTERQRRYRERLYKAGFKQIFVWVKRKEEKTSEKMSMTEFVKLLNARRKKSANIKRGAGVAYT
ncbi:hypothetical protein R84B8_01146 [Treponema sp. R8-4-B8]